MNSPLLIWSLILLVVFGIYALYRKGKNALIREKKAAYDHARKSGDRQAALEAGRRYYAELRGGTLSVYDEQALNNDLSTM